MMKLNSIYLLILAIFLSACTQKKTSYYPNGVLMSVEQLKNGKEDGLSRYYYDNGILQMEINYVKGQKEGTCITYYDNRNTKSKSTYKNNQLEGKQFTYYENGKLMTEFNYVQGKLNGESKIYQTDGIQLRINGFYNQDAFDGHWEYFDDNGLLIGEADFKNGNGIHKTYNEKGQIFRITPYQNNMKNGAQIDFDAHGDTVRVLYFKDDQLIKNTNN